MADYYYPCSGSYSNMECKAKRLAVPTIKVSEGTFQRAPSVTTQPKPVASFLSLWSQDTHNNNSNYDHIHPAPLGSFVNTLRRCSASNDEMFVLALIYAHRYRSYSDDLATSSACGHCVFLGCMVLACKYLQDVPHNNSHWARTAGVSVSLVNSVEVWLLQGLRCELYIHPTIFEEWMHLVKFEGWTWYSVASPVISLVKPDGNTWYTSPPATAYRYEVYTPVERNREQRYKQALVTSTSPYVLPSYSRDVEYNSKRIPYVSMRMEGSTQAYPSSFVSLEHSQPSPIRNHTRMAWYTQRYQPYKTHAAYPANDVQLEPTNVWMRTPVWSCALAREQVL